jgi:hypothetical protein
VELGQAEAIGVENEHDRGLRHVHADLQHRGPDEHVQFAAAEEVHGRVSIRRLHLAVHDTDSRRRLGWLTHPRGRFAQLRR